MNPHHADRAPNGHNPHNQPVRRKLPCYKVILLHNATLDLMFIVRTVMQLTRLCRAEATHKMWEAVNHGQSVVLVTYRERAEFFAEQFADAGLPTRLEPA